MPLASKCISIIKIGVDIIHDFCSFLTMPLGFADPYYVYLSIYIN